MYILIALFPVMALLEDSTLRGDTNPIGFLQNQFNPYTGEIIPSEDTDEILTALGKKYCTADLNNSPNTQNTPPLEEVVLSVTFLLACSILSRR